MFALASTMISAAAHSQQLQQTFVKAFVALVQILVSKVEPQYSQFVNPEFTFSVSNLIKCKYSKGSQLSATVVDTE